MRFLTAGLLFLASIVLIVCGIGQRTIWVGPATHVVNINTTEDQPFYLVPNAALAKYPGTPTITIKGAGSVFAATGRESDIDAWLGTESNAVVTFGGPKNATVIEARTGAHSGLKPVGSDLWRTETTGAGRVKLINVDPGEENALLLARDGVASAPGNIKLVWRIPTDFTYSNYLLIAGAATLVLAFLTNFFSLIKLGRERRPRRKLPKAPRGPKYRPKKTQTYAAPRGRRSARNFAVAAPSALLTLAMLAGCAPLGATATPTPTSTADATQPPSALNEAQIKHILVETAFYAKMADTGKDRHVITNRFAGPALEVRNVHYYLQAHKKDVENMAPVSAFAAIALPAATKAWPRTFMAVTQVDGENLVPQMLVFQQDSPRVNYKVLYTIELVHKTPPVASVAVGAIPTAPDSGFLVMKPLDIVRAYGDTINNSKTSKYLSNFDLSKDAFHQSIVESQAKNLASLKNARIVFEHQLGSQNILGLNTLSNGALVALYMLDVTKTKPKNSNQAIVVNGNEKVLLGSAGSPTGITTTYGDMMLFFVPNTGYGKVSLLGCTSGLISVKALH